VRAPAPAPAATAAATEAAAAAGGSGAPIERLTTGSSSSSSSSGSLEAIQRTDSLRSRRSRSASVASAPDAEAVLCSSASGDGSRGGDRESAALAAADDEEDEHAGPVAHRAARTHARSLRSSAATAYAPLPPPAARRRAAPPRGCCVEARRLLGDRAISVAIGCYCLLGTGALITNELQPLYLLLPTSAGGFGWGSSQIGIVSAMAGPPLILFQLFAFDRLVRRFGLLDMARWSFVLTTLCVLVQPWCSLALQLPEHVRLGVVAGHFAVLALSRISCFTCVFVFVANAALPVDRGRVNGLSQALVSAARAVGPPLFTPLFAWAVESKLRYPLDVNLPFVLLAALTAATLALTYALPPWVVRKRAAV